VTDAPATDTRRPVGGVAARVAGAALLIGVLTVAARLAGFARTVVYVSAVGDLDLGQIYTSANTVPNIIFEIVAGGALASLVVPLVAGAAVRGDRAAVGATASALLTWVLTLLVPAAIVVALAAEPIVRWLVGRVSEPAVAAGSDMLRVFAPQLPLYGVGIVLTGVLQAYRKFSWPVLAPLLSSLTVMAAYLTFALMHSGPRDVAHTSGTGLAILSVGTTLGVAVLTLCLLIPLRALGLRLRPTYGFPTGAAATVRRLAMAGAVTVAAQQLTVALVIYLANRGARGALVQFTLAQTVYLLPWAVLALPIATSSYPTLAEAADRGDRTGYAATLAGAIRGVVLFGLLGTAALAGLASPLAWTLGHRTENPAAVAAGIAGLAPGLLGYALFALLSRALYARGDTRLAAGATVVGWVVAAVGSIGLSAVLPAGDRVAALALANSAGMVVLGVLLLVIVAVRAGRESCAGLTRALLAGLVAAALAAVAGDATGRVTSPPAPGVASAIGAGVVSGVVVLMVFLGVVYALDRRDVHPLLAGIVRRLKRRDRGGAA
jgi:putative peptidoglycan lipid II flippase